MIFSILILFAMPFISKKNIIQSNSFKPFSAIFFWIFVNICLILGWIGSLPVMEPFLSIGQYFTLFYFGSFLIIMPLLGFFENLIYNTYKNTNYIKK
jgi:ubiquinol-cytochrome c reductase cytochrome b subunit